MRYALAQVLVRLFEKHRLHLDALDPESLLTPILLSCNFQAASASFGKQSGFNLPIDQEVSLK